MMQLILTAWTNYLKPHYMRVIKKIHAVEILYDKNPVLIDTDTDTTYHPSAHTCPHINTHVNHHAPLSTVQPQPLTMDPARASN